MSVVNLIADPEPPKLEFRPIDSLAVYAKNSRTHSNAQVQLIANLIDAFGWTNAVLADEAGIVAGHGRVEGAKLLYKQGKVLRFPNGAKIPDGMVPVVPCDGWSADQRRAYIIADNASALQAGWDEELLRGEVLELQAADFDLELTGLTDQELHDLLEVDPDLGPDKDPDDAPDVPEVAHSVPGDVWVLGPHRVMCGSSLSVTDWGKVMAGEKADLVWTDPPYNVDIGGKNEMLDRADGGNRAKSGKLQNDKMGGEDFYQFLLDMYSAVFAQMKAGAPIYVAHADIEGINFRKAFVAAGFKLQSVLIWNKNIHVLGRWDYLPKHEPIIYGWKPGASHRWYGGRKNTTVMDLGEGGPFTKLPDGRWQIKIGDSVMVVAGDAQVEEYPSSVIFEAKPAKSDLHPTMKPVALVERMLRTSARTGDIVIDAFGGSGTTLIAADRMGMCARLMELDPKYVDVIVKRWQTFTGRRAVHAETGQPFPEAPGGA